MKKALVTGANRSIGLEVVKQLLQKGVYVYLGCRDIEKGKAAVAVLQENGFTNVEPLQIDISISESIQQAKVALAQKTTVLDILVNNAGILGDLPQTALGITQKNLKNVFNTNFFGTIETTQNFYEFLEKAEQPRIVNVTSGLGSLTLHSDSSWKYYDVKSSAYVPSKTALNAYTVMLAYELRNNPKFKVNAVDPGYTATEFNNFSGPGDIPTAASYIVAFALLDENGKTGSFISYDSNPETGESPW
ncbi:SDR family NAD(P)-dependent oxidoreductase [Zhouia sp. PK063]|uniref:SDR family NAD(P)-dependent oxidoreductase n=1 Tax=Zhouia sp. PK063 TaxID=3373602 RepID=UPI00379194B1